MSTEGRIHATLDRHPDWDDYRVSHSLGVSRTTVAEVRAGVGLTPQVDVPVLSGGNGKDVGMVDLSSVIKRYDIKAAILSELGSLPKGKLIAEDELCKRTAGTDKNRFRRTVENNPDELNPLRIKLKLEAATDGKFFWGRASDVASALKIRDL